MTKEKIYILEGQIICKIKNYNINLNGKERFLMYPK